MTGPVLASPLTVPLPEHLTREPGASRHAVESCATVFGLLAVFAADKRDIRLCTIEVAHFDVGITLALLDHLEYEPGNGVRARNPRLSMMEGFCPFLEFRHLDCLDMAARVHAIPQKMGDVPATAISTGTR